MACLGSLGLAAPANAAERPRRYEQRAPAYSAVYNWTGFYLGINGGGGFGRSSFDGPAAPTGNFNTSGGLVGVTAGYNWQVNQAVFGIETDIDWTSIRGRTNNNRAPGVQTRHTPLGRDRRGHPARPRRRGVRG